jgi:acyl-[acyl-carrier-protein]-phospholipid O-acyltransferase/long-chain-fatty-acid--[acyl-carrier-protein] ligase
VIPFLLFSNIAGAIADKVSKQKIIVWMKALEVAIIFLAFYVYAYQIVWGCYFCVFLLSLQSAIMSPPKYSIISELVDKDQIPKANSYITSYTYIAIILGTFMASFLTQVTGKNFLICLTVCLLAALIGFIASLNIPLTKAVGEKIIAKRAPFSQLKETLSICKKTPKLLMVVIGSAFFLFIGAFTQLNLIPFAIISLKMTEVGGGYLFLATSMGIAVGSIVSGKLCKKGVNLGVSSLAMLGMAILVFMLPITVSVLKIVIILGGIGFFGGLYQIPLESYMQTFCASEQRGKVVAASNFLSFCGVLLAPLSMALFEKGFGLTPSSGFLILGFVLVGASLFFLKSLLLPSVNLLSKGMLHKFYDIYYQDFPFSKKYEEQRVAIFIKGMKKRFVFLLLGETSHAHIFIIRKKAKKIDRFLSWIHEVDALSLEDGFSANDVREKLSGLLTKVRPIFILEKNVELKDVDCFMQSLKNEYHYHVRAMDLVNRTHFKPCVEHIFQKTALVFSFKYITNKAPIKGKKEQTSIV